MQSTEWQLKKQIVEIGQRIWQRGFVAANDGNISIKLNDREILTTPTGVSKGFMDADMILKVDFNGKILSQNKKYQPSSEVKMHLEIYRSRPDINAVVHAHPPYCTSFAVAGVALDQCVLPEAIIVLGAVPTAAYGLPSTEEIPKAIRPHIQNSDAVLLENHGALTLGTDLINAYFKLETLEHTAKIISLARQLGGVNVLPRHEADRLLDLRQKMNIPGKISACRADTATESKNPQSGNLSDEDIKRLTNQVLEEIKSKKK